MTYFILTLLWLLFCSLHSLLATEKCKTFFAANMGASYKFYRLFYSLIAVITLTIVLSYQFSIHNHSFVVHPILKYLLAPPFLIIAIILMTRSISKYFYRLSGVQVLFKQQNQPLLETSGIHSIVRHPLYTGTLLMIWTLLAFFPTDVNFLSCMIITVYVRIGVDLEERKLVKLFKEAYTNYKKTTPMFVPTPASLRSLRRRSS